MVTMSPSRVATRSGGARLAANASPVKAIPEEDAIPPLTQSSPTATRIGLSSHRPARDAKPPRANTKLRAQETETSNPEATDTPPLARPYCFWPLSNNPRHSEVREPEPIPDDVYVHPDEDPAATRGIPIFKPSYDEFKQFDVYMERVRPWGERSSIVKIIPPKEWVDAVQLIDKENLSKLEIRSPIEQRMKGQNGVFIQLNVERNRTHPLSIHEWFDKCQGHPDLRTPNPKEGDRSLDRDSKEARALAAQIKANAKAERLAKKEAALKRKEEKERRKAAADAPQAGTSEPSIPHEHAEDLPGLDTSSHTSHSSGEPLVTTPEAQPPYDPFYDLDWKKAWLPEGITDEDFDVAGSVRVEQKFWKSLGTGKKDSWYGADLAGSLFADPDYPWNVANLPNLLNRLPGKIPGVNSPYLYFGMWRAAFSWHVEDMDLYSINYIHFGAPKQWYAVPQTDAERFESIVRSYFPSEANGCDQFMRHKSCTISPFKLHNQGIRVNKLVQHQNEFVITFPRGYHAGYNMGFNCAESVNFALPNWVELGRKAKACTCVEDSVRIDVDYITGDRVASPEPEPLPPTQTRKRKLETEPGSARRRRRTEAEVAELPSPEPPSPTPLNVRIPIVRLPTPKAVIPLTPAKRSAVTRDTPVYPCVLCPSLATEDLAPVFQPSDHIRSLSKTIAVQAHISCAIALPEAYTDEVTISDDSGANEHSVTYIKGLENVDKARWKLKCSSCVDKRTAQVGTKIQCTKGKCIRAFHIPCARDNDEVHYFAGERTREPAIGDQAALPQPSDFVVELLCQTHNPASVEIKKRKVQEALRTKVLAIPPGSVIKFKSNGSSFEAQLMEVKDEQRRVLVHLPDLSVREIAWSSLDFRPGASQLLENEYAGPPKRSRKETAPAPFTGQTPYAYGPRVPDFIPRHPAEYYGAPQMFPPANSVLLVDSKHPAPPQRADYGYAPYGPGPMVMDHMRGFPPSVAYAPRIAVPAGRMLGYGPPRMMPHGHSMAGPPPMRAMTAGPPNSGPPPIGGWPPPSQNAQPPPMQQPQQPVVPSGVGKIDLGLDRMLALMGKLPPLNVPAIHLAGTNGKGSVSVILESCFNAAGLRTARYNSPHLLEPRDAVRIDGQPVSATEYAAAIAHVQRVSDDSRLEATTFEIGTAAAYLIANTSQADVMIIECGMGGARDATNVIPPHLVLASGLTSVGLDHTDRLGDTITKIAREKASIVVPGGVIVVAPHLHPEALSSAQAVASERGAHLVQAGPSEVVQSPSALSLSPFKEPSPATVRTPLAGAASRVLDTHLGLGGAHQLDNLSLALTMLDVIRNDKRARTTQPKISALSDQALQEGVARARWQGRCAWVEWKDGNKSVPFLVDGAHNADSAVTLRHYLDSLRVPGPRTFVVSLSASPGKTPEGVLGPLLREGDRVALASFTTPVEGMPWIRGADPAAVRAAAQPLIGSGEVYQAPGSGPAAVADALRWSTRDWETNGPGLTVVCGSLYLVADAYRLVGAQ